MLTSPHRTMRDRITRFRSRNASAAKSGPSNPPTHRAWPRIVLAVIAALVLLPIGCRRPPPEPVTLTFFDPGGLHNLDERRVLIDSALQQFTRETGIRVNHLPAPETNQEQLLLARELLQRGAAAPDVLGVDLVWTGELSDYLLDLRPYLGSVVAGQAPQFVAAYSVQGKLVALPLHPNLGVLLYRADLLRKYGYTDPPQTWDELENMAARIQKGERANGSPNFWGFVWPGAPTEALTCIGLEWQVDEGGGRIIEDDRRISVNNPDAIRAWERAAHWVGTISPPSVVSYQAWDVSNALWVSGDAAFAHIWSNFFLDRIPNVPLRDKIGVASLPGGKRARGSVLGGFGLAIAQESPHRAEALKLVEFLAHRDADAQAARRRQSPPEMHRLPPILWKAYPWLTQTGGVPGDVIILRPSAVAGNRYEAVSQAYQDAMHAVLTGQSTAPTATADLEKKLKRITGFEAGRK